MQVRCVQHFRIYGFNPILRTTTQSYLSGSGNFNTGLIRQPVEQKPLASISDGVEWKVVAQMALAISPFV